MSWLKTTILTIVVFSRRGVLWEWRRVTSWPSTLGFRYTSPFEFEYHTKMINSWSQLLLTLGGFNRENYERRMFFNCRQSFPPRRCQWDQSLSVEKLQRKTSSKQWKSRFGEIVPYMGAPQIFQIDAPEPRIIKWLKHKKSELDE